MTPLALEMLLWLRTRGDLKEFPTYRNEPQQRIAAWFAQEGVCGPDHQDLTERGNAWLDCVLQTPLPVAQYADPRTGEKITLRDVFCAA